MKDNNYSAPQVNKNGKKKFLASVMALVLAITGGIGAKNAVKSYKGKNVEPTSQSDTVKTDPQEDLEYVLVEPFDINDEASVKETINAVNENNKNDDSVKKELSEKVIKFYNGTLTRDDFSGMSDDDIANEVKNFTIELYEVTSASILDYANLREGEELTDSEKSTKAIGLSDIFDENGYAYQTYANKYDAIVLNEQKKDIANGDKEDYSENSNEFVALMKTALKDDKLTKAQKAAIATITKAQSPLFWSTLSKSDQEYFEKEDQGKYNTSAVDEWFQKYDIVTSIDFNKTNGGDKSKNEYVASDKADAEKHAGSTKENETKLVKKGGKKATSKEDKKVIEEATTRITYEEETADVDEEDLTKESETTRGGESVSTSTHTETTSKISEEDVAPEEETTISKSSNEKSASSKTTTTTTTANIIYKDSDDDIPTYTDKEFSALSAAGVASAALGSIMVLKKKKRKTLEEIEAEEASKSKKHR